MCPSYPFIRFHNILCFPRPLIREKYIYDESNGLWYELQSDYLLYPLSDTSRRRKQAYRHLGAAAQGISERTHKPHTDDTGRGYKYRG